MIQLLALASPNPDPMHPEPENQLVQRASSGCDEAYATLIAQNVTLVRSILGGYLRDDNEVDEIAQRVFICLLYTSPSPRDRQKSRMPSSA